MKYVPKLNGDSTESIYSALELERLQLSWL